MIYSNRSTRYRITSTIYVAIALLFTGLVVLAIFVTPPAGKPLESRATIAMAALAGLLAAGTLGVWWLMKPLSARMLIDQQELASEVTARSAGLQSQLDASRQSEAELLGQCRQVARVLDSAGEGILSVDERGYINYVNRAAAEMLRQPARDLCGQPVQSLWGMEALFSGQPAGLPKWLGEWPNGRPHICDGDRFRRRDGSELTVETISTPVVENEQVRGAVLVFRDISDRKQSENALRNSEEKFSRAFHASPSLLLVVRLNDGRCIDTNRAFANATGYTRDEIVGRTLQELNLFADERDFQRLTERMKADGRLQNEEATLRLRSGQMRVGLVASESVEFQGQACALMVLHDMTDRFERLREREAVASLAADLRTTDSRQELLELVAEQVTDLLHADGCMIVMRHPGEDELVAELSNGTWAAMTGQLLLPQTAAAWVVANGKPYVNNEVRAKPDKVCQEAAGEIGCYAGVPLVVQNATIGSLSVGRSRVFGEKEIGLLQSIADMAASAIQRVTLFEQTEHRVQRLAALHNIDLAISAGLDLPLVQSILLAQATAQMGNDAASIWVFNPTTKTLRCLAAIGFRQQPFNHVEIPLECTMAGQVVLDRRMVSVANITRSAWAYEGEPLSGSEDFVTYHGVPLIAKGEVKGVMEIYHRRPFQPTGEWLEFLENLADQAAIAIYNGELYNTLQRSNFELEVAYDTTLEGWARALELRDRETEGHSRRVTDLTIRLARTMGVPESEIHDVRRGSLLHDIGKMVVPDSILFKAGPLMEDEWTVMRQHPELGARLLEPIPFLRNAMTIPYCHHERWDGSGYPRGLRGEEIPLVARIFAVVDVWDALRSDRPYRKAWSHEAVVNYIEQQAGRQFDPKVVEVFLQAIMGAQVNPIRTGMLSTGTLRRAGD